MLVGLVGGLAGLFRSVTFLCSRVSGPERRRSLFVAVLIWEDVETDFFGGTIDGSGSAVSFTEGDNDIRCMSLISSLVSSKFILNSFLATPAVIRSIASNFSALASSFCRSSAISALAASNLLDSDCAFRRPRLWSKK